MKVQQIEILTVCEVEEKFLHFDSQLMFTMLFGICKIYIVE